MSFDLNQTEAAGKKVLIQYSASGNLSNRSTFDDQPKGFIYADTSANVLTFYVKTSDSSNNWSNPFTYVAATNAMDQTDWDANNDGNIDLATGGTGVSATNNSDLRDKLGISSAISSAISAIGSPVVLKGSWDASSGTFPANTVVGWSYIVSANGTVDSVDFTNNDRLLSLANNASTSIYDGNWIKLDYTDQVLSVAGLTGAITAGNLATNLGSLLMPTSGGTFSDGINFGSQAVASATDLTRHISLWGTGYGFSVSSLALNYVVDGAGGHYWYKAASQLGYIKNGLVIGAPTNGDPGTGKVNAVDYQINGTPLSSLFLGISATAADSSKLNGQLSTFYQTALSDSASIELHSTATGDRNTFIDFHSDDTNTDYSARLFRQPGVNGILQILNAGAGNIQIQNTTATASVIINTATFTYNGNTIWHSGNDGPASGLDADTVDGFQAANFVTSAADDSLTAGYSLASVNDGTKSSGTYTPTYVGGNMRYITNGGAFTFAAPSASGDYTLIIQITNSATAGAITMSGFSKVSGDSFTTTSGDDFFVSIIKNHGFISATVQALQ